MRTLMFWLVSHMQMYHVELFPKLEYQPTYGLELVTPSEAARNWTSLCIRNNCRLIRGNVQQLARLGIK